MRVRGNMASTDVMSVTQALADQPVSRSTGSRPLLALFVLVLLGLLCAPLFVIRIAYDGPKPSDGTVSFAHWGALTTPVPLGGRWMFVWQGDAAHPAHERLPMTVPGTWEGQRTPNGTILPISGVGSYLLTISDLPPGLYTLHVPIVTGASRVWIDGKLMSSMGTFGNSPAT